MHVERRSIGLNLDIVRSLDKAFGSIVEIITNLSGYGETGRRDGLKIRLWKHSVGSNPTTPTIPVAQITQERLVQSARSASLTCNSRVCRRSEPARKFARVA